MTSRPEAGKTHERPPARSTGFVRVRFYEELNDFLDPASRKRPIDWPLERGTSVADLLQSFGVPAERVELVLVNGESVSGAHLLSIGDRVSCYPVFESFDVRPLLRLRKTPLRRLRFVFDRRLVRAAWILRVLGFDVALPQAAKARLDELGKISLREGRVVVTSKRALHLDTQITRGFRVGKVSPSSQVMCIISRFDLYGDVHPWTRCVHCNAALGVGQLRPGSGESDVCHVRRKRWFPLCTECTGRDKEKSLRGIHAQILKDVRSVFLELERAAKARVDPPLSCLQKDRG